MTPRLIAFSGFIGAGKTTAAKMLADYDYVPTKFAKPLKAMLISIGLTMDDLEDPIKKSQPHPLLQGRTPRHAMQSLGSEWGRDLISTNFWAGLWAHEAGTLLDGGGRVVVDDMRFPNEVQAVRRLGGLTVYIIGVRNSRPQLQHRSEDGSIRERCDVVLYNDKGFHELRISLEALLAGDYGHAGLDRIVREPSFLEGDPTR
jgi:hypothetical protein